MKVILDTNFLLIPFQFRYDIYADLDRLLINEPLYELATLDSVISELDRLGAAGNPSASKSIELAKLKNVKVYTSDKVVDRGLSNTDNQILSLASPGDIICTQDLELKSEAKKAGIRVVSLRSGGYLGEV